MKAEEIDDATHMAMELEMQFKEQMESWKKSPVAWK